jgi:hypothetical protein
MKILAKVLLYSGFVFFARVPAWAQDCGHAILWDHDEQSIIDDLVQRQDCLNKKLEYQDNDDSKIEIYDLQDKLKQNQLDLHTAETKIETLEASLQLIERRLDMAEDEIGWLTPRSAAFKTPVSKPKITTSKPTAQKVYLDDNGNPIASKPRAAASKPKTPVNKPAPGKPTAGGKDSK